jgi:hypothetical protein
VKVRTQFLFGVWTCILLAGSIAFARQQDHQLTGIHGIPVQGHDVVAGLEIVGTKRVQAHNQEFRDRLRANGADMRLGWPLESQMLCRYKEVLLDVMREKGFPDVEVTHDMRPTYGNPRDVTLTFTVVEGKRSRRSASSAPLPSPAERCSRLNYIG